MADARTSGTAVTRIFSILEVFGRDEDKALDYMKKLRANVQVYTKSGGGGTIPVGLGQAGGGIFFIVDALKTQQEGYDVSVSFPKEGIGTATEAIALIKGAKNPETAHAEPLCQVQDQFPARTPGRPDRAGAGRRHEGCENFPDRQRLGRREPQTHGGSLGPEGSGVIGSSRNILRWE